MQLEMSMPASTSVKVIPGYRRGRVLSPREREVATLVARGLSNKEVARELGLSSGTVKIHLHNIFQKLGAKSRYGLIGQAISRGVIA